MIAAAMTAPNVTAHDDTAVRLNNLIDSSACCSPSHRDGFALNGFVILPNVLEAPLVAALNERLEYVLRGTYDRGQRPDKTPKLIKLDMMASTVENKVDTGEKKEEQNREKRTTKRRSKGIIGPLGFSGSRQNAKVLQVINVHKCDKLFRKLVTSADLGRTVAKLAGWKYGARLAQDQVWAKPPGSPSLVYHRDSPYFMFDPPHVVTVWIALDDMEDEVGPLVYVKGSHKWGEGRVGSAGTFFDRDGGMALLKSAAEREGIVDFETEVEFVSTSGLAAGGLSIHNGRTWHGSGANCSQSKPRRGIGIHYVPAEVKFTAEAAKSKLWGRYVLSKRNGEDAAIEEEPQSFSALPEEDFPIIWQP